MIFLSKAGKTEDALLNFLFVKAEGLSSFFFHECLALWIISEMRRLLTEMFVN